MVGAFYVIVLIYSIDPGSNGTIDGENGTYTNFFASDYCLMQHFDLFQMVTLCITGGYLTFDIYICYAKM